MKQLIAAVVLGLSFGCVHAADVCEDQAAEKKLAGAAKNSFVKKCRADAGISGGSACEAKAQEKKLAGAAKNSFLKDRKSVV